MPNISLNETDRSTYKDQQFISIAYSGKTNITPPHGDKTLKYKVEFIANDKLFYAIEVNENQKISAPVNNPESPSEELSFKEWQLDGEAFNFNTIVAEDITLIAEFEEAGEEVIYEKTLTFFKEGELSTNAIDLETSLESLGFIEGQNYTMKIGDLSLDCVGMDTGTGIGIANADVESQMKWLIMPWSEEGSIFISYFAAAGELFTGEYLVKIVEAEAPVEDVIWEDTLEFVSVEEEMPGWLMFNGEEAFPELDKLNTTDTFTFSIPELNKSVTGKFTKVSEEDNAYILGEEEDGINLQANTLFYTVVVEGDVEGTYTVKLTKSEAPAPSGNEFSEVLTYTLGENGYSAFSSSDISEFISSFSVEKQYSIDVEGLVPQGEPIVEAYDITEQEEFAPYFDKVCGVQLSVEGGSETLGAGGVYLFHPAVSEEASAAFGGMFPVGTTVYAEFVNSPQIDFSEGAHLTTIKKTEASAPSGYTWDGMSSPEDVVLQEGHTFHKVSNDILTTEQLVGAQLILSKNGTDVVFKITDNNISSMGDTLNVVALASSYATMALVSGEFEEGGLAFNGTYFEKIAADATVSYTKALTFTSPSTYTIWFPYITFISSGSEIEGWGMYKSETEFPALSELNTVDTFTFSIPKLSKTVTGKFTVTSENVYVLGEETDGIIIKAGPLSHTVLVGDMTGSVADGDAFLIKTESTT